MTLYFVDTSDNDVKTVKYLYKIIRGKFSVDKINETGKNTQFVFRGNGYKYNEERLSFIKEHEKDFKYVLTNDESLLNVPMFFNTKKHKHDIYLYSTKEDKFKPIQEFTTRVLREAHSLERLYRAGEFEEDFE